MLSAQELVAISTTSDPVGHSGTNGPLRFRLCSGGSHCCLTPFVRHSDLEKPDHTFEFNDANALGDCQRFPVNTEDVEISIYTLVRKI